MADNCNAIPDACAFKSLYVNYRPALYAFVGRTIEDEHLVEDIVQNAFIKIWINMHQYDERKAGIYTWMISICRNEMIDFLRSQKRRMKFVELGIGATGDDTSNIANRLDVSRFISTLNNEDSDTVNLYFLNGYTYNQVSRINKSPIGSVKTKVRRIVKTLREDFT